MAITLSVLLLLVVLAPAKGKSAISVRAPILRETQANVACLDPDLLGIHETVAFRSLEESNYNIERAFKEMESLGVRKLRLQIWRGEFWDGPTKVDATYKKAIDQVIGNATLCGIDIMGYAEDFPIWMRMINASMDEEPWRCIPRRNDPEYGVFLERYEQSWETLAREFPNITMWEIGNEYNLDQFLRPEEGNFSPEERVNIVTDLLYYGSRGINSSNPNAKRVMGGLGPGGNGIKDIENFTRSLYENIESGKWNSTDPDDFFQVACWHPYTFGEKPNEENWVEPNKAVYEVMKNHSDGNKSVIFSEMGYSDNDTDPFHYASPDRIAEYLLDAFGLAQEHLQGWLETIYWYSLTDRNKDGFGVLESPETWAWKRAAYAYKCVLMTIAFGSSPGDFNWNQAADLCDGTPAYVPDGIVDIFDIVLLAQNFGKAA